MHANGKMMEMLTAYAAAHQHPFNIFVHMIGIPAIMLGALIPLTWLDVEAGSFTINLAHLVMLGFFVFYMTLDKPFAAVFLFFAMFIVWIAGRLGSMPMAVSGTIAAAAFFGGYAAQFVGHAVERSMPVLVKHPIQANLAAPFFTVVEMFKLLGVRGGLFDEVQKRIEDVRERG